MAYKTTLILDEIPMKMIPSTLERYGVQVNDYARVYMNHRAFQSSPLPNPMRLMILSLEELGFKDGAALPQIIDAAQKHGLYPCSPVTGVYLRLNMLNQKVSKNSILTGAQDAPEGAITVISHFLERDSRFPRGLYLRNVDGVLWLRGYICDEEYMWKPSDVFAFEIKE